MDTKYRKCPVCGGDNKSKKIACSRKCENRMRRSSYTVLCSKCKGAYVRNEAVILRQVEHGHRWCPGCLDRHCEQKGVKTYKCKMCGRITTNRFMCSDCHNNFETWNAYYHDDCYVGGSRLTCGGGVRI